jgi:hypothetical protein
MLVMYLEMGTTKNSFRHSLAAIFVTEAQVCRDFFLRPVSVPQL